ncbi:hypothetical protein [Paraburkholderia guartelaensis]|uniref:hypothetical protein n=1 Tax=Paraburkholderia guartelaensis TaxID=2546446 RepID=UPI003CCC4E2F
MGPVDLSDLTRQHAQTQEGFGGRAWTVLAHEVPEVVRRARVAALTHHRVQAAGCELREFIQGLPDERQVRFNQGGAWRRSMPGQACLGQHTRDGRVMNMQLPRDGAAAPFLDVVQAQDLRLQFGRNGHGGSPDADEGWMPRSRRRTKPVRTNGESRQAQRAQCNAPDVAVCAATFAGATATSFGGARSTSSAWQAGEP